MRDSEKSATAELAFELGKITRHAMHHCNEDAFKLELSRFSNQLLQSRSDKIARDVLMVFVAGFHEAELLRDRQAARDDG